MQNVKGRNVTQQSSDGTEQIMRLVEAAGDVQQLIEVTGRNTSVITLELEKLRLEIQKYHPAAIEELTRLKDAEKAAHAGDSSKVLEHLKGTGRLVGDFAAKLGTSIVTKLIEKQIGL
jgi:hypothetical protein